MKGNVEGKGVVVFSSCSHAGMANVIRDAVKTFNRPIYMIVDGMHLASADLYPPTQPSSSHPAYILPAHRTGWEAKAALGSIVPTVRQWDTAWNLSIGEESERLWAELVVRTLES